MKRKIIFGIIALLFIVVLVWFGKMNKKSAISYETEKPFRTTIVKKTVATGKVTPQEEVEIKPQISGIIDKVYLEEGDKVKKGDLIARIRVVPNEQSLISANGRINSIKVQLNNAKTQFERSKSLFEKGVVSKVDFERTQLSYNQAKQDLRNAQNDYQIIKKGSIGGGGANTNIRATASGMLLQIPVEEGDQVIQANNFNPGTTIASIADMGKMIFEGKVDESEVNNIKEDVALEIKIAAVADKKFPAKLSFIAPKGTEQNGTVQFTIKADVTLEKDFFLRAGYSANAEIVLEKKDSVLSVKESLLRFDKKTEEPYVEVKTGEGKYEKKKIKLGLSDGENVEILEGITVDDEIKIWNKLSKKEKK